LETSFLCAVAYELLKDVLYLILKYFWLLSAASSSINSMCVLYSNHDDFIAAELLGISFLCLSANELLNWMVSGHFDVLN